MKSGNADSLCSLLFLGSVFVLISIGGSSAVLGQSADGDSPEPEKKVWRQAVEIQPSIAHGSSDLPPAAGRPVITDQQFHSGPVPKWIWGRDDDQRYVLRTEFQAADVATARLKASCDNIGTVYVNGVRVASGSEWQEPMTADVTKHLVNGGNVIEAEVANAGGVAAFVLKLAWIDAAGGLHHVATDESWLVAGQRDEISTERASLRGVLGDGPWGNVLAAEVAIGRVPRGMFEIQPDFQVEKLFSVPQEELGSWVCITFDAQGRLLASDQGDKGICRITPGSETVVERLDFSRCAIQPTAAQGMLWAFDSLYLCINGGPGSGLYRARDLNGDDQFDECVLLKSLRGGGEHGPHALRLSPDGTRIFLIAGNHTRPPFNPGQEQTDSNYTSRIPTNWDEDLLLPRMWDANGHARGVMAPGGWIASTDADGVTWDLWSIGYRNPYDMAFNADGELFTYDADMEWDLGMPWYRPTRVVHATSGSEFGWRSGSGKWPEHYPDSLPEMIDIGPGSPVGMEFGYGLQFPATWQKALYICDWTFGTMYAIHIEPDQSSYRATREEFLSRTPLPLTDVVAGPDGALYFTTGGRGTQSELFRVTYTGSQPTDTGDARNSQFADRREQRRRLERTHGRPVDQSSADEADSFLQTAAQDIASGDRFLQTASRNAFFSSRMLWQGLDAAALRQADLSAATPDEVLAIAIAFARAPLNAVGEHRGYSESQAEQFRQAAGDATLRALRKLVFDRLTREQQLSYLRAFSLLFLRLGEPTDAVRTELTSRLSVQFPGDNDQLNRELLQMLVYLGDTSVIATAVELLDSPDSHATQEEGDADVRELLARNRGYGGTIAASLSSAPNLQQIWYAFCLRNLKDGWTMDQRKSYFSWFERANEWAGGASFRGFLRMIEQEAFENASEQERLLIEASGARRPYRPPELPTPVGPGRDWTLQEVRELAEKGLTRRNFENGQKMYAATRCIVCHRFVGEGGATGPDLTQLAGRFNLHDLTEAIMDPGKVVSDQYRGSTVVLTDGRTVNGRIVSQDERELRVLTDPEDSTKLVTIAADVVEEIVPSTVSLMPQDLLKPLNDDEVLDLLAYLLSRGDSSDRMFRRR